MELYEVHDAVVLMAYRGGLSPVLGAVDASGDGVCCSANSRTPDFQFYDSRLGPLRISGQDQFCLRMEWLARD